MATRKSAAKKQYKVLIGCINDNTGKEFTTGDTVTDKDFSTAVIGWFVTCEPPVLKEIKDGA